MREVIFEAVSYNGIKGRLKALFCCHVEKKLIDKGNILVWECIYCKQRTLWILKEID